MPRNLAEGDGRQIVHIPKTERRQVAPVVGAGPAAVRLRTRMGRPGRVFPTPSCGDRRSGTPAARRAALLGGCPGAVAQIGPRSPNGVGAAARWRIRAMMDGFAVNLLPFAVAILRYPSWPAASPRRPPSLGGPSGGPPRGHPMYARCLRSEASS